MERSDLIEEALRREAILSTAVDHGLAFPHVRGVEGGGLALALGVSEKGIDFGGLAKSKTRLVFFIAQGATPVGGTSVQLPTFSNFSVGTTVSVPDRGAATLGGAKGRARLAVWVGAGFGDMASSQGGEARRSGDATLPKGNRNGCAYPVRRRLRPFAHAPSMAGASPSSRPAPASGIIRASRL